MRIPKIYLETTMFNYYFDVDRDAHTDTVRLFKEIQAGKYEAFTSVYVTEELLKANEPKRSNMLAFINEYKITVLLDSTEARQLANIYVNEGIIPDKYRYDGLHIAITTIQELDCIFSLNFQHINKLKTKNMTSYINVKQGYKPINICSPMEAVERDEE